MEMPDAAKKVAEKVGEVKDAVSEKLSTNDEIELKGGFKTKDVRLDRVLHFDPRSRNFPIRTLVTEVPRTKTWTCSTWNDQGSEGACVGFAWSHELSAEPVRISTDYSKALAIYKRAQFLDPWPGENYSGTSVLAGAKAVQELKSSGKALMPEYRWAFSVDDLVLAIGNHGPAVIGVWWYRNMMRPDSKGFIYPTGGQVGGHAILVRGITIVWKAGTDQSSLDSIDREKSYFTLRNSWGKSWGVNGDCYLTVNAMDALLRADGEACVPVKRIEGETAPAVEDTTQPAPKPEPSDPAAPTQTKYFSQRYTKTFHENHRGVRKDEFFASKEAAAAAGKVPCRACIR